jgi:hypothetical protein
MKVEVQSCDAGLSGGRFGTCALDTQMMPPVAPALPARLRLARAAAGVGFLVATRALARHRLARPLAAVAGWFGVSHVVAGISGYRGCPELGAIASLVAGRRLHTVCGPWDWLDAQLDRRPIHD